MDVIQLWALELRNETLNDPEQWGLFSSVERAQEFVHDWITEKCPDWIIKWTEVCQEYDWFRTRGIVEGKKTYFVITSCTLEERLDDLFEDDSFYSYMYDCIVVNGVE